MKILVDKMPKCADDCVFSDYQNNDRFWGEYVCSISNGICDIRDCPYLKEQQNER